MHGTSIKKLSQVLCDGLTEDHFFMLCYHMFSIVIVIILDALKVGG